MELKEGRNGEIKTKKRKTAFIESRLDLERGEGNNILTQ